MQRGRAGQHGRADHALGAADYRHVAEAALVRGVGPGRGGRGGGQQGIRRHVTGHAAQVVEPDLARRVAAVGREQAGLERQQAQAEAGGCAAIGPEPAAVGVQAGGQVHAQQRRRARAHAVQPVGHRAFRRPPRAQAEEGVDGEVELRGRGRGQRHAGRAHAAQRGGGVLR